ncbi:hypothetical protein Tco_1384116 [Tanacetum coccineum]
MEVNEILKKFKKGEYKQISHDEEVAQKLHAEELAKVTTRQEQEKSIKKIEKIEASGFSSKATALEKKKGEENGMQESSKQVEEEIVQQDDVVTEQVVK